MEGRSLGEFRRRPVRLGGCHCITRRSVIRNGARARCFNAVELVNHLLAEAREEPQGCTADQLARRDLVVSDELGYVPCLIAVVFDGC